MNNAEELFCEVQLQKKGLPLVMEEQNITAHDIMNTFYKLSQDVQNLGVEHFKLEAYNVVFGNFVTGIKYSKDDEQYYMMIGADNYWTIPRQIAVGTVVDGKIYMMCEDLSNANSIDLIAFPKFVINQRMKGLTLSSYRDTIQLFFARQTSLSDESLKCLKYGFESIDVFCSLINQVKNQNKRKKLSI